MWDYQELGSKRKTLADMSPEQRESMTWGDAWKFVRNDTMAIASMKYWQEKATMRPFDAVCVANGFDDLLSG